MSIEPATRFPIYLPTKSRADSMYTSRALTRMGCPHYLVVEPQQVEEYERAIATFGVSAEILVLDLAFKETYELCDALGQTRSTGPGPARNFAWEHSRAAGYAWHWVMDDNIRGFWRLHQNRKIQVFAAAFFAAQEEFVLRYTNIGMAGPNYFMFAARKNAAPPFIANTRIYSCNLIRNDVPYRWRGRYNEDTILSLDMLKAGWATVQFNAFLQWKSPTQSVKGGNTEEFYHREGKAERGRSYARGGTFAKSAMIEKVHPDVSRVTWKFKRVHHEVDYSRFRTLKLIRREDLVLPDGPDNMGLRLVEHTKPR